MKEATYKSLSLNAKLQVPATVDEFDKNAKREGACLDEANNNVVYRSSLAELRDLFLHGRDADTLKQIPAFEGIEQVTKVPRKTKETGRKAADGTPILTYAETEVDYFQRVCLEQKVEPSSFQPLMDKAAALVEFDASAREKKPAQPKKLAAKYAETAQMILKGQHLKRFVADAKKALGVDWAATGDTAKDTESLGWIVKQMAEYREKQELLKMAGAA
jgi:hypothetical protein